MNRNILIVQCSECNLIMGNKPGKPDPNGKNISHGVCSDCLPILYADDFSEEEIEQLVIKARNKRRQLKMKIRYRLINIFRQFKFRLQPAAPVGV